MVRGGASKRGRGRGTNYGRGRGSNSRRGMTTSTQRDVQELPSLDPPPTSGDEVTATPSQLQQEQVAPPDQDRDHCDVNSIPSRSSITRGINQGVDAPTNEADRELIKLYGDSFHPVTVIRSIGIIVREWMREPLIRWKLVPEHTVENMWKSFQERYIWNQPTQIIKEAFFSKCRDLYASSLYHARKYALRIHQKSHIKETKGLGPPWMRGDVWNGMVDAWMAPEWQRLSHASKENRLTEKDGAITKHTSGSISIMEHRLRLKQKFNRDPTDYEVYEHIHKRRGKEIAGDYVDPKSKRVCEDYSASLTNKYGQDPSSHPDFDPNAWIEAVGAPTKGRLYGFGTGNYAKSVMKNVYSATSEFQGGSLSEASQGIDRERLRQEVREEVLQEVRQEFQQEMQEFVRNSNMEMEERLKAMVVQLTQSVNSHSQSTGSATLK